MSDEQLKNRITEHVNDVMTQYKGAIPQWDVLNEPLNNNVMLQRLGYEEIVRHFNLAKAIDPDASLYVNETGISDLAPGSVIQPMLNNEQLTGFTLFYDGKNPVYYEYSTYTLPAAITDSECMILSGRVYSVTTNGFMYTKNAGGEEITVMRNITAGSGTKIYLAEDGKVSECTRDEIRENDKVILYYDYASLNMIVIQR